MTAARERAVRKARVFEHLAGRPGRSSGRGLVDDGGAWYACPGCGAFRRFGADRPDPFANYCRPCGRMADHVRARPSYAPRPHN